MRQPQMSKQAAVVSPKEGTIIREAGKAAVHGESAYFCVTLPCRHGSSRGSRLSMLSYSL